MAEERKEIGVSAPRVMPVVLAAAGAVAALWWCRPRRRPGGDRADRPIIMTGGSFHLWAAYQPVEWDGFDGAYHTYEYPETTAIQKVLVKKRNAGASPFNHVESVYIRLGSGSGEPDIVVSASGIRIKSDSPNQPLEYIRREDVDDDFETPMKLRSYHHRWRTASYISEVVVWTSTGQTNPITATSAADRLRLRIDYN